MAGKLVIVRHGESEWNAKGVWTGTTNVRLTDKGRHESRLLGELLKDIRFDEAFVSEQIRTEETLEGILSVTAQEDLHFRIEKALNERDYGKFTGKNKWQVKKAVGEEAFQSMRRGWNFPVPEGETLKDVYNRSVPFFLGTVLPMVIAGKTVLIVAHGNSIRSLMKYIESISDSGIEKVEMIFGTVLIYQLDREGHMISKEIRKIDSPPPPA